MLARRADEHRCFPPCRPSLQREDYSSHQRDWYLLRFAGCRNCSLTGGGTVDGRARLWCCSSPAAAPPAAATCMSCRSKVAPDRRRAGGCRCCEASTAASFGKRAMLARRGRRGGRSRGTAHTARLCATGATRPASKRRNAGEGEVSCTKAAVCSAALCGQCAVAAPADRPYRPPHRPCRLPAGCRGCRPRLVGVLDSAHVTISGVRLVGAGSSCLCYLCGC